MDFKKMFEKEITDIEDILDKITPTEPKEVYGMLYEYIKRGGKRLRPVLLLTILQAFGGEYTKGLLPGGIIELFHNFTLIHDDIEDDSDYRRGKPTLHKMYGIPIALNAGDALYTHVFSLLNKLEHDVHKLYISTFREVVEGQGYELWWEHNNIFELSEDDYFLLVRKKTGALIGLSAGLGVYLSGNQSAYPSFYSFGVALGIAFQIQDDLLNLYGDFEKYKKTIGDDITEGKRTLMVIHALNNLDKDESERLKEILSMHTRDKKIIKEAISLITKSGAREYAQQKAKHLLKKESEAINPLLPDNEYSEKLRYLTEFIINRKV